MTDTARHADVVLPATTRSSTSTRVLVGPPLPDPQRARDRAARGGQAEHRDLPPAGGAPGLRRPLPRASPTSSCSTPCSPPARRLPGLRDRGWAKVDLGQGDAPHAEGGFGDSAKSGARRAAMRARPAAVVRAAAEVSDASLAERYPARPDHAQDAPVPQLDVRQPAPPALRAAGAVRRDQPGRRRPRATPRRRPVRVCNDRGAFRRARVSDDAPAGRPRRADGLVERRLRRTGRARRRRRRRR